MKNENIYWSTTVQGESKEKLNELRKTYINFFRQIKEDIDEDFIKRNEFIELVKSIGYINNHKVPFKQDNIAKLIWSKGGWLDDANSKELTENLNSISNGMNRTIFGNFNYCNDVLNLYDRKYNPEYSQLVKRLERLKRENREIHYPDSEIIVDCHDLTISQKIDIIFVSSDGDIIYFKNEIKEMTNIKDIVYLKNASPYINN